MSTYRFFNAEKTVKIEAAVTVLDVVREPGFYFAGESHDFWELVYIVSGKAGITADDRIYTFSAGDLILHKPMEFHKIWSVDSTRLHIYIFSFMASGGGMKKSENRTFKIAPEKSSLLDRIMKSAKEAFVTKDGYIKGIRSGEKVQVYFNLLELLLIEISGKAEISFREDANSKLFAEIIRILNDNIYENITVNFVAEQCFISTAKLKKLFNRYTGMGVMAYFTKLKIKKAMELLAEGFSVREVSERLSYSSQFYLSQVFKKEMGISPSEYKRGCKNAGI